MTYSEFLKEHSDVKGTLHQSESSYEGTKIGILYVHYSKPVSFDEDTDPQNYLVLSENAAKQVLATNKGKDAKKNLQKAVHSLELSYDEEAGWGLIRPFSAPVLCEI